MSEPDPIITIADLSRVSCVPGIYRRFSLAGGDYRRFVRQGLPLSQLKGHGYDALVDRIVEAKLAAEAMGVTVPQAPKDEAS